MTTTVVRTRADIELEIRRKRAERELYVSPQGVAKCHAELDALLEEWERCASAPSQAVPS